MIRFFVVVIILVLVGVLIFYQININKTMFKVYSPSFANNQMIPEKYTCDGENIIPPLVFENIPAETKSLVIIMDDPDSPSGDFLHWIIWNIGPDVKEIKEGVVPVNAVEGKNDFGKIGYGGPCPGTGTHRYVFNVYALNGALDLPEGSERAELEKAMKGYIMKTTKLIGKYIRVQNR